MSPEISIYLQKVKKYLETNQQAKEYFIDNNYDSFFDELIKISNENLEKNGDPSLSVDQFEEIRLKSRNKKTNQIYMDLKHYGKIYLN